MNDRTVYEMIRRFGQELNRENLEWPMMICLSHRAFNRLITECGPYMMVRSYDEDTKRLVSITIALDHGPCVVTFK